jgi:hypothetical protein
MNHDRPYGFYLPKEKNHGHTKKGHHLKNKKSPKDYYIPWSLTHWHLLESPFHNLPPKRNKDRKAPRV